MVIIDRDTPERFGGLRFGLWRYGAGGHAIAKENGHPDNPATALKDWLSFGELDTQDTHSLFGRNTTSKTAKPKFTIGSNKKALNLCLR